ncbi:hypothetical protein DCAR_0933700 [Daucus carota subsp. sativus]|uniref:Uncharacterized protein n=1 Tax=Daucus carota subsp. sativus TaxID=79200 RepID=A0A175YDV6_DAUCS|nr:hypothetical protein DCAR_0933700 [Daucus carota subsp. sativus]
MRDGFMNMVCKHRSHIGPAARLHKATKTIGPRFFYNAGSSFLWIEDSGLSDHS